MSLDIKVMQMLDRFANQDVESKIKDGQALDYINNLPLPPSQPYLRNEYKKYYFSAKRDYIESLEEKGYGYGV